MRKYFWHNMCHFDGGEITFEIYKIGDILCGVACVIPPSLEMTKTEMNHFNL